MRFRRYFQTPVREVSARRPELHALYDAVYAQLASGYQRFLDDHCELEGSSTVPWVPMDLLVGGAQQPTFT